MKVNFLDLHAQYLSIKEEIDDAIQQVLARSAFAAGPFVKSFEEHFAAAHQAKCCVGVNSGTAALHIVMMALEIGPGDEVLVPANTFFATPEAVSLNGARPVFVDQEAEYYNIDPEKIEQAITPRTRAIIAVNLYGQPAQLERIKAIADKHHLVLIEDCAQSHLATLNGKSTGTFGLCGCFSFYPGKNLGAYGEGGAVITDDEALYKKIMMLRDHGSAQKYHHDLIGHNYRLEGMQGAILDVKLKYLPAWTEKRRHNAALYRKYLRDIPQLVLPAEMPGAKHVYHIFCVRVPRRDEVIKYLGENQIYTNIHYPIPCHLQKAYAGLGYKNGDMPVAEGYADQLLSLPMSEQLKEEEIQYVAEKITAFYQS
ncbi:MAG TPA: DegT/DnrJ/EryC1/StrS family aminotransferase [bacterium]|nr:DegT/DnrJ/EryC1/StrS family aminotransferase [bacterium]